MNKQPTQSCQSYLTLKERSLGKNLDRTVCVNRGRDLTSRQGLFKQARPSPRWTSIIQILARTGRRRASECARMSATTYTNLRLNQPGSWTGR